MNDFDVRTNSLKITHSDEVSRPHDGCKLTGYERTLSERDPLAFSFHRTELSFTVLYEPLSPPLYATCMKYPLTSAIRMLE